MSEETTIYAHRTKEMADKGELAVISNIVNDCTTKSKFENVNGRRRVYKCKEYEDEFEEQGALPDPNRTINPKHEIVCQTIKDSNGVDPTNWTKMAVVRQGRSEDHHWRAPNAGDGRQGELLFTTFNGNGCTSKSTSENVYGCRRIYKCKEFEDKF